MEAVHVPALLARGDALRLAAVADADPARLRRAAAQLGDIRTYAASKDLFSKEDSLDFVVIDTPTARRTEHILRALGNKAHVLCERPLCLSIRDWDRIRKEAARQDRCAFTVNALQKCPQLSAVRRALDAKLLGRVSYAAAEILRRPEDGKEGILAEAGWDAACLVRELVRQKPRSLAARLSFSPEDAEKRNEEAADVQLHFDSAAAHLHLSRKHHARRFRAAVCGTAGRLELNDDTIEMNIQGVPPETIRFSENVPAGPAAPAAMAAVLDDFLAAAADPARREENIAEAGDCVRILMNIYYSNASNSAAVPL